MKRAGLDYREHVDLRAWPDWDAPLGTAADVALIFGWETAGLPADLPARYADRFVTMPIASSRARSLNPSTSVGIAVYEVPRQRRGRAPASAL